MGGMHRALATEPLSFSYRPNNTEKLLLSRALEGDLSLYQWARVDLNLDGIEELVAKDKGCRGQLKEKCHYVFIGRGAQSMHVLLDVVAWNVVVSDKVFAGVRNILVFKNENNQFKSSPYTWNALKSGYTEGEGEKRS